MTDLLGCNNELIEMEYSKAATFQEVFENHDENLSVKWSNYLEIYEDAYHRFIGNEPNVLEIGVQNGGSLQIANKYFKNGNIYGVDINPKVCEMYLGNDIKTYCFDIKNTEKFKEHFSNTKFDVILDDGSHLSSDVIITFKTLFQKLNPNGVYVIEDLQTSYWPSYEGGYLKADSSIEFLKNYIDLLNIFHISDISMENFSETDLYVVNWLKSITFYDNVVVITKLKEARVTSYDLVYASDFQPIINVKN